MNNIYEHIRKAKIEAEKNFIEANTIIIDTEFARTNNLFFSDGYSINEYPPMIFGLKVFYGKDLPNNADFIVTKSLENKMEKINNLEQQLGIDLITLFRAEKVFTKFEFEDGSFDEIKESYKVHFDLNDRKLVVYEYPEDEFGTKYDLRDFGRTWSLQKEDLEDEKED